LRRLVRLRRKGKDAAQILEKMLTNRTALQVGFDLVVVCSRKLAVVVKDQILLKILAGQSR
jgi:hypothetical protein